MDYALGSDVRTFDMLGCRLQCRVFFDLFFPGLLTDVSLVVFPALIQLVTISCKVTWSSLVILKVDFDGRVLPSTGLDQGGRSLGSASGRSGGVDPV